MKFGEEPKKREIESVGRSGKKEKIVISSRERTRTKEIEEEREGGREGGCVTTGKLDHGGKCAHTHTQGAKEIMLWQFHVPGKLS